MKKIALVTVVLLALFCANYIYHAMQRQQAMFSHTLVSPNQEYRVDSYYIKVGEPMIMLFRIYNKDQQLIKEVTREVWPGAWLSGWDCAPQSCTEFRFSSGDAEAIALPPDWFDRLRAKLP